MKTKILILGGTTEGRELATIIDERFKSKAHLITSLAGRTHNTPKVPGEIRVGGFGGADGLAAYISDEKINLLIDATHPFAENISNNASIAANMAGIRRVYVARANWKMPENADALYVPDMIEAARVVARTARRAFLTIGVNEINAFKDIANIHFLVRMIGPAKNPPDLVDCEIIYARPPFNISDEEALMKRHDIDVLVTKASGGDATFAKIAASTNVGARIILIRRPPPPDGDVVWGVENAVNWVDKKIKTKS